MNVKDCLDALHDYSPFIPVARLNWLRSHWGETEPRILKILGDAARRPKRYGESALNTYSMYLAAEMGSKAAHPCFLDLCRLPEEDSLHLLGDILTRDMSRFLVSTWDGDLAPFKALIEDRTVYDYGRAAAVDALTDLVLQGRIDRSMVILYFHSLLTEVLEKEHSFVWDAVASSAADLQPSDLMEALRDAYAAGYIDPEAVSFEELKEQSVRRLDHVLAESRSLRHKYPVGPVEQEIRWMEGFRSPPGKVGRNDPCPCGSGKKYKKCCLR